MTTRKIKESPGVLIARATDRKQECIVRSSNGDFLIYPDGRVKLWQPDPGLDPSKPEDKETLDHYGRILRFNTVEYLQTYDEEIPDEFDILDLGFWYDKLNDNGKLERNYEPPEYGWRKEILKTYEKKV